MFAYCVASRLRLENKNSRRYGRRLSPYGGYNEAFISLNKIINLASFAVLQAKLLIDVNDRRAVVRPSC